MAIETLDQVDLDMLELTRLKRVQIINKLMENQDKPIPDKTSDKVLLVAALDGMDRQIFSKAKVKTDEQNAASKEEIVKTISHTLSSFNVREFKQRRKEAVSLTPEVTIQDIVPGETDIQPSQLTLNDVQ